MDERLPKNNWVKTPTVYQMEATECGAASLCMILQYYGCYIPLEQLRIDCGVSRDGCNAKNIKKAGIKYGLEAKAYSKSLEKMLQMQPPCILHWNFNHFVVYEGCKNGYVYINDPALGRRKLTYEDINDSFTGVVLSFTVGESFVKTEKNNDIFKLIRSRLIGNKKEIAALLAAGLILVFPGIVIPVFSQIFVDDILAGGNTDWLGALILAMIGTVLFQAFFTWLKSRLLLQLQLKLKLFSGYDFLSHMFKLPISFFEQRYAGDLAQRVDNNNSVNDFLAGDLTETVLNVIVAVIYLIILVFYSPVLTLIGVIGVAINITSAILLAKSVKDLSTKVQQDQGKLTGSVYSGISIMDTLKASGAENVYTTRILGDYARYTEGEQKIGRKSVFLNSVPGAITQVFDVIVIMIGGLLVIKGDITAGVLVGFSELLGLFTSPLNSLVGFFTNLQTKSADMSRVNDIEKYPVSVQFEEGHKVQENKKIIGGIVELRDVSFGYSPLEPPLIENFSFKLDAGKTIALVGASGSGKSTVGKLVSGLNDPWGGEILIDNVPLREIPPEVFTSSVATVSQSISLFACSVRDNLTLWNENADEVSMINAAKDACIHDTIVKHEGAYSYKMDEGGTNFSGGQRQRLEIARALTSNPRILILDEATSALDAIVEQKVMENIKRRGCTCIIVAHRLSTIRDCDEIIVMENGKIVQRGTHAEMTAADGPYKELIKAE